ncbi:hypothetical protein E5082_01555 [Streptomyces griseoluteus]|uniref:Uncharacterized protein n=1 Tax=Streptomyces griseoluteus TaxID=29306 RepID=A0A4Z1DNU2_STRGP|nr:hypothetical protein [Streptomyces griseoluteus]TGN87135.1 hypothetical protein E5082_01555 [Streptomyces griseoluteus]GHF15346.1 hypothetical protein GCM10017776_36710 [Streptomyces griseoluteus]
MILTLHDLHALESWTKQVFHKWSKCMKSDGYNFEAPLDAPGDDARFNGLSGRGGDGGERRFQEKEGILKKVAVLVRGE